MPNHNSVNPNDYMTVTALANYIHGIFLKHPIFRHTFVKGEISDYRFSKRMTQFFKLKDHQTSIQCVVFKNVMKNASFKLKNGMKVLLEGSVSTYTKYNECEFYVHHVHLYGVGELFESYHQFKDQLEQNGRFNFKHKRIPKFPKRIAVITSEDGSVIRDIINTCRFRCPSVQIVLFPAHVQGPQAAPSLAKQINRLSDSYRFDTVIIARGGGSIEDLWAFNERPVIKAVINCQLPVIASIGHGTDHTLTDAVADRTVVTPTAAAEVATPDMSEALPEVKQAYSVIKSITLEKINSVSQALSRLASSYVFNSPQQIIRPDEQSIASLAKRLRLAEKSQIEHASEALKTTGYRLTEHNPISIIKQQSGNIKHLWSWLKQYEQTQIYAYAQDLDNLDQLLRHRSYRYIQEKGQRFKAEAIRLDSLNPYLALKRGYSLVIRNHRPVEDTSQLKTGQIIRLKFKHGQAIAVIKKLINQ